MCENTRKTSLTVIVATYIRKNKRSCSSTHTTVSHIYSYPVVSSPKIRISQPNGHEFLSRKHLVFPVKRLNFRNEPLRILMFFIHKICSVYVMQVYTLKQNTARIFFNFFGAVCRYFFPSYPKKIIPQEQKKYASAFTGFPLPSCRITAQTFRRPQPVPEFPAFSRACQIPLHRCNGERTLSGFHPG